MSETDNIKSTPNPDKPPLETVYSGDHEIESSIHLRKTSGADAQFESLVIAAHELAIANTQNYIKYARAVSNDAAVESLEDQLSAQKESLNKIQGAHLTPEALAGVLKTEAAKLAEIKASIENREDGGAEKSRESHSGEAESPVAKRLETSKDAIELLRSILEIEIARRALKAGGGAEGLAAEGSAAEGVAIAGAEGVLAAYLPFVLIGLAAGLLVQKEVIDPYINKINTESDERDESSKATFEQAKYFTNRIRHIRSLDERMEVRNKILAALLKTQAELRTAKGEKYIELKKRELSLAHQVVNAGNYRIPDDESEDADEAIDPSSPGKSRIDEAKAERDAAKDELNETSDLIGQHPIEENEIGRMVPGAPEVARRQQEESAKTKLPAAQRKYQESSEYLHGLEDTARQEKSRQQNNNPAGSLSQANNKADQAATALSLAKSAVSMNKASNAKEDHLEKRVTQLEKKTQALEKRVETMQGHLNQYR
ncbi:MAG: hypothetical protein WCD79_20665 [Chthoniobacteraceae bacterium]